MCNFDEVKSPEYADKIRRDLVIKYVEEIRRRLVDRFNDSCELSDRLYFDPINYYKFRNVSGMGKIMEKLAEQFRIHLVNSGYDVVKSDWNWQTEILIVEWVRKSIKEEL